MKRNLFWSLLSFLLFLSSCTYEEEDLFDQSAAQRLNASAKEYRDLLVSSQYGWTMEFWPNNGTMGGYVFTAKFAENGDVEMMSEEDITYGDKTYSPGDVFKSNFSVKSEQSTILTFDTYNPMFHKFSEPRGSSNVSGYNSDYEFVFLRTSENQDTVYFRGKKYGMEMVMTRLDVSSDVWIKDATRIKNIIQLPYENMIIEGKSYPISIDKQSVMTITDIENDSMKISTQLIANNREILLQDEIELTCGVKLKSFSIRDRQIISTDGKAFITIPTAIEQLTKCTDDWLVNFSIEKAEVCDSFFDMFKQVIKPEILLEYSIFQGLRYTSKERSTYGDKYYSDHNTIEWRTLYTYFITGYEREYVVFDLVPKDAEKSIYSMDLIKTQWGWGDSDNEVMKPLMMMIPDNSPYRLDFDDDFIASSVKFTSVNNPNIWFTFRRNGKFDRFSYDKFDDYWNYDKN